MVTEQQKSNWEKFTTRKSLLVGDSTIKDIDERKLHNTKVICLQGGRIESVHNAIQTRTDKYENVTLSVGSNYCTDEVEDLDTLIPKYRELISSAQRLVTHPNKIVISSVLPRCNEPKVQEFIEDFNEDLEKLANEKGASFVNNDREFKLLNRSPNEALFLQDGIHPTYKATNCLGRNLKLQINPRNHGDICKRNGSRQHTNRNNQTYRRSYPHHSPQQQETQYRGQRSRQPGNHGRAFPNRFRDDGSNNPAYQSKNRPKCWNCGESNHMARNCRHGRTLTCHKCGENGHKSKFSSFDNYYKVVGHEDCADACVSTTDYNDLDHSTFCENADCISHVSDNF